MERDVDFKDNMLPAKDKIPHHRLEQQYRTLRKRSIRLEPAILVFVHTNKNTEEYLHETELLHCSYNVYAMELVR